PLALNHYHRRDSGFDSARIIAALVLLCRAMSVAAGIFRSADSGRTEYALGEDRRINQRPAARAGGLGPVAFLESAAAGRAAHPGLLHHHLAARQGHDRVAGQLAALVGRVVAVVMED